MLARRWHSVAQYLCENMAIFSILPALLCGKAHAVIDISTKVQLTKVLNGLKANECW